MIQLHLNDFSRFVTTERVTRTTKIERKTMDIEERGVKLRLTVVDTPGMF